MSGGVICRCKEGIFRLRRGRKVVRERTSTLGAAIVPGPPAESDGKSYEIELPNWAAGTGLASIIVDEPATMSNKGENMIAQV